MNDKRPEGKTPREKLLANLATPWKSGGLWLMLQVIVIWTVLFVVLLNADLGTDETRAQPWLWGLMVIPWFLFVASYLMAGFAPKPQAELPYNVDYEVFRQCTAMANFALQRAMTHPDLRPALHPGSFDDRLEQQRSRARQDAAACA